MSYFLRFWQLNPSFDEGYDRFSLSGNNSNHCNKDINKDQASFIELMVLSRIAPSFWVETEMLLMQHTNFPVVNK